MLDFHPEDVEFSSPHSQLVGTNFPKLRHHGRLVGPNFYGNVLSRPFWRIFFLLVLRLQKRMRKKPGPSTMVSNFQHWLHTSLVGLVCAKGSKGNGLRVAASVVLVPNLELIFAGDVKVPFLLRRLLLLLLLLCCCCCYRFHVREKSSYTSAVVRRYSSPLE